MEYDLETGGSGNNTTIQVSQGSDAIGAELGAALASGRFQNMAQFRNQQSRNMSPIEIAEISLIDDVVTQVGTQGQSIIPAMIAAGMVKRIPNWVGVTSIKRKKTGRAGTAHVEMEPESRGERFRLDQGSDTYPFPVFWANFDFSIREEAQAERLGDSLDTTHVENATVNVNIKTEAQAISGLTDKDGSAMKLDGLSAPGLLNSTTTWTYSDWTGLTGAQLVDEVISALALQDDNLRTGAQTLFVPTNYQPVLLKQYAAGYPKTILQALKELEYNNRPLNVQVARSLPAHRAILMDMTRNTGQVVVGQGPVPISWLSPGGWRRYWMVVACMITMITADSNGEYGVIVGNVG
jgi:hypothetical protein